MSDDIRSALAEMADDTQAELDRALAHHEAVVELRDLAWSVDDHRPLLDPADVEARLEPLDAARWRNALTAAGHHQAPEQDPNPEEEPTP
ncbi:MAG: hypothetical protein KA274_08250 [Ilumatobacteraceae bacterium]|jgi:uncharacterized protein YhdP|nr:hypothetical protein [Acidimicrobiaceae bacterium]MBP6487653.1 hypothetical protein [Ilumatobacteraceae bacterium]MBP7890706.1 hypothetical protein [Ilumatobacteraceae bacterium]